MDIKHSTNQRTYRGHVIHTVANAQTGCGNNLWKGCSQYFVAVKDDQIVTTHNTLKGCKTFIDLTLDMTDEQRAHRDQIAAELFGK